MINALSFPQRNKDYGLAMRTLLYGITGQFDEEEPDEEVLKTLPKDKIFNNNVNSLMAIAPMCGFLKPYECQVVSVNFHPTSHISFLGQVKCHIVGGMTETLNIAAMSSDISFSIDEVYVDFGRQVSI